MYNTEARGVFLLTQDVFGVDRKLFTISPLTVSAPMAFSGTLWNITFTYNEVYWKTEYIFYEFKEHIS